MKVQGNRYINNPEMIKNKVEKKTTVPQNIISEDDVKISDSARKLVETARNKVSDFHTMHFSSINGEIREIPAKGLVIFAGYRETGWGEIGGIGDKCGLRRTSSRRGKIQRIPAQLHDQGLLCPAVPIGGDRNSGRAGLLPDGDGINGGVVVALLQGVAALMGLVCRGKGQPAGRSLAGQGKQPGFGVKGLCALPDPKHTAVPGGLHRDDLPVLFLNEILPGGGAAAGQQQYDCQNQRKQFFHGFLLIPAGGSL